MKIFTVAKGSTGFDGLKRGERERPTAGPGRCSSACGRHR